MKFEGNKELPSLDFNEVLGELTISGRSISIEKADFWQPLIDKMEEYLRFPVDITLTIDLEFFNTRAARSMLDLFHLISQRTHEGKKKFIINWVYDDEDLLEAGEDYSSIVRHAKWNFIEKNSI